MQPIFSLVSSADISYFKEQVTTEICNKIKNKKIKKFSILPFLKFSFCYKNSVNFCNLTQFEVHGYKCGKLISDVWPSWCYFGMSWTKYFFLN